MIKKLLLVGLVSASFSFAEQLNLSLPEAVSLNHKLIKDLYNKIEALENEVRELKVQKVSSLVKESEKKYLNAEKANYFVAYEILNVRSDSDVNSKKVGELKFGDSIYCENINNNDWCKIDEGKFIYKKSIVKLKKENVLIINDTYGKTRDGNSNISEFFKKGENLEVKGVLSKKWFVTDDNKLISTKDAITTK